MASNRKFFREKALIHYQQNQAPDIVPQFVSSFDIFLYWVLFLTFVGAACVVWAYGVPQFTQGSGVIQNLTASSLRSYGVNVNGQGTQATAIIFFSTSFKAQIQAGSAAQLQIKGTQQSVLGTVKRVEETTLTLDQARQRYHLSVQALSSIPQPALIAFIVLNSTGGNAGYEGKPVTAQVQVAVQNVLSLFFNALKTAGVL